MSSNVDWFLSALDACYEHPGRTLRFMQAFADAKGCDALIQRLTHNPEFFEIALISPIMFKRRGRHAIPLLPLLARQRFATELSATEAA